MTCSFEVYGYRFSVQGNIQEAVEGPRQDFAFFSSTPCAGEGVIELIGEDPPFNHVPAGDAAIYTSRNVVYREGRRRYVDYHGRGLGIYDEGTGKLRLYSRDHPQDEVLSYRVLVASRNSAR